ncbi:hypothetical protein A3A60_04855 [Candidatus Curtissbacteria bacterium RIFCSPLOWO2_01_FULL_42_26]|uniref:Dockerin domain-containing protein n=1 Tax=Candidatus Curtissbacteria bacterium RIFCSPLOWO2_01_FULL_42_26 TaxID=1797729 RepID=A0A1F5I0E9_9BACT|nr:MAG: hypothetical protein A3A60_04855 [Candidatus Curtissbacteria bacterium RIFCSPLOWO2_01_FULL_42_26]
MRSRAGVIQVLLLLLALSVIAASSVSIMAQQKRVERQLSTIGASPNLRPSAAILPSPARGPCYPVGDVNNDGVIKPDDVQIILNYVAGIKPAVFTPGRADVNKDGKITSVDAQLIKQFLEDKIKTFKACGS